MKHIYSLKFEDLKKEKKKKRNFAKEKLRRIRTWGPKNRRGIRKTWKKEKRWWGDRRAHVGPALST